MSQASTQGRLALKTPEAAFLRVLTEEFGFSFRVSRELLQVGQEMLGGGVSAMAIRPGQVRLVVVSFQAPFGPPLAEVAKVEVTLTVDTGAEDAEVRQRDGLAGLRRGRILRLSEEALAQGGVLTQEDLGRALGVESRTIRRDIQALKSEGHLIPTRGQLKGVGRGQTHKVKIIELWLDRQGYDQIARRLYHSPQAIKRYVSTFLRMVVLHQQETTIPEIAFLTQTSERLVGDYLAVYQQAQQTPHRAEKLAEELARVSARSKPTPVEEKKGVELK
jgi:predicted ArsR family transcriptional regulator